MMERYTSQSKLLKFYRNSESVASTLRELRVIYGRNNRPSRSTIESTGTVQNVAVPVRQRSADSVEIAYVTLVTAFYIMTAFELVYKRKCEI